VEGNRMIVNEDLLSKLRHVFSLNLYEVRIWTALLSRGVSTAGELSDIGDVPRSRAYDVLESLEKRGFVIMKLGKPIKYLAIEPKEVVERVKRNIRDDAEKSVQRLRDVTNADVIRELTNLHKQGIEFVEPADLSGALRGRHNLYAHLEMMLRNAEKSVTIATTSKGFLRKVEALGPVLSKLSKKNVSVKIAAPITAETKDAVKEVMKYADVRNLQGVDARFCIIDGKEILFMVIDDKDVHPSYDIGVWVNTPFFAGALENIFDATWSKLDKADAVLKKG